MIGTLDKHSSALTVEHCGYVDYFYGQGVRWGKEVKWEVATVT